MGASATWILFFLFSTTAAVLIDRNGLEYVNSSSYCAIHCTQWRQQRPLSECTIALCPDSISLRRLKSTATNKTVTKLDLLTCTRPEDTSLFSFSMHPDVDNTVFDGFQHAFFQAFDAMVTSVNATYEACQFAQLQQTLLPNTTIYTSSYRTPMVVKLSSTVNQYTCMQQIRTIWEEEMTPFLSRADQRTASATVVLVHVDQEIASSIVALDCVDSVVELPPILKLLPFARSAESLVHQTNLSKVPRMRIQLTLDSDIKNVMIRLSAKLTQVNGIMNFYIQGNDSFHSIYTTPVSQLEIWIQAISIAIMDPQVEWIDVDHQLHFQDIQEHSYTEFLSKYVSSHRNLDEYVEPLLDIDAMYSKGIKGNDMIVGMTDSGIYLNHDQFDQTSRDIFTTPDLSARKVVYYNAFANANDESETVVCGHGTHVAGLLAGSSYSKKMKNIGIAENARIAFMDIGTQDDQCIGQNGCPVSLSTPADSGDLLQNQMQVGAKIFSFSWGTPGSDYSSQARDLDAFLYKHPDILVIIAAGNSGEDGVDGKQTISSPSGAKNVISVGASLNSIASFSDSLPCPNVFNPQSIASFSSAGPTTDGRMKPDVVAPGMALISAQSELAGSTLKSLKTCKLQGTSQATPIITGMAVLLYEWLRDGWWKAGIKDMNFSMTSIPASLLKALLIHSSQGLLRKLKKSPRVVTSCDQLGQNVMSLSYPDVYQGYGKPNMSNIADISISSLYFLPNSSINSLPRVSHQKQVIITFMIKKDMDVRVTIVWTDVAGSIRSIKQLQHDLDLTVRLPNTSHVFYPLTSQNQNSDEENNVEMVQVSYAELIQAVSKNASTNNNSTGSIGPNGEIVLEAVIYGKSILQAESQAFAFVASSSVIGNAFGIASDNVDGSRGRQNGSTLSPLMIGGIIGGVIIAVMLLIGCFQCCRRHRQRRYENRSAGIVQSNGPPGTVNGPPTAMYMNHSTPVHSQETRIQCPFCFFTCVDAVNMVDHVEQLHSTTNRVDQRQDQCPFCMFNTMDPVLLVNHVQHVHPSV